MAGSRRTPRDADRLKGRLRNHARGDIAELYAELYFIAQGFWVARTMHSTCPYDLVVANEEGQINLIDVKTSYIRSRGKFAGYARRRARTPIQRKLNVALIYVDTETGEVTLTRKTRDLIFGMTRVV